MEYKRAMPVLSDDASHDSAILLGYIEDIKAETAVRISALEILVEILKEKLSQSEVNA